MKEQSISIIEKINIQLQLIEKINKRIASSKKLDEKLMVKQYEHLKNQYVQNLYEMLAENYQIPIPSFEKKAA